jgi:hypothetical protein
MSNIVHPTITLTCDAVGGAPVRQYLWYVDTSLAGINAQRAAVAAQIAAGTVPTGYVAASPGDTLQLAPTAAWNFPQQIWAFVVAESTTSGFTLATDTVTKNVGDGW